MPTMKWSSKLAEASKAPSFKDLEEDTYNFVIKEAGKVGEYNGVEQISVRVSVESGPRTGSGPFHNFNFPDDNPQVLRIVFEQFQALGLGEDFFQSEPTMEQVAQALKGRRFTADVVHTKSNTSDKTFVNLRNFKPAVSPSAMPAGPTGPGGAGPNAGPAGPQAGAAPWAAQPQQAAPQTQQAAPAGNPWEQQQAAAPQTQQAAPAGNPWEQQQAAPQQQQQQQQFAQAPQQQQAAPAQTWQPPVAPPLS